MWEWFVANRIWIFIAAIVGFILAYFLRNRAARATARVMPTKVWRERMRLAEPLVSWILFGVAGGILGTALAAVIISYYQINIRPGMAATGNWFLTHSIPILIIAVPAYIAYRIIRVVLPRIIEHFIHIRGRGRAYKERLAKRSKTLGTVLTATIGVIIAIVASFMVLSEHGSPQIKPLHPTGYLVVNLDYVTDIILTLNYNKKAGNHIPYHALGAEADGYADNSCAGEEGSNIYHYLREDHK
ncbi:hypothetical protein ES703_115853 [subsurface metagenome]